jgi:hypothetical protein
VKTVWKWTDETKRRLVVTSAPVFDEVLGPSHNRFVRAKMTNLLSFEEMERTVYNMPRTKVIYCAQTHLGGYIPTVFVNRRVHSTLMHLSEMRKFFDKSLAIDVAKRNEFVERIKNYEAVYSQEEKDQVERGVAMFTNFDRLPEKTKIKTVSPSVSSWIGSKPKESVAYGKSEVIARASMEQLLAFNWLFYSRERTKPSDLEKTVVQDVSLHHMIAYVCEKGTHAGLIKLLPREGVSSNVWKQLNENTFILVATPTKHAGRPITSERVRISKCPLS